MKKRKLAISDIHGCCQTFRALLKKIDFRPKDELYLLGDYIDRGVDSKGVIDTIWEYESKGYNIHYIRGNHEDMLVKDYQRIQPMHIRLVRETYKSFGVNDSQQIPKEYMDWIQGLPYYLEVDKFILVHGGLNFRTENPLEDQKAMITARRWHPYINKKWLNGRIIVHGHTPEKKKNIKAMHQNIHTTPAINIDNGCVYSSAGKGHLCCLDLSNWKLVFQENLDGFYNV